MINRYDSNSNIPQPIRKVIPSGTDILHHFKMGERIDNLAEKYYNDATEGWIIMCANPEYDNEFDGIINLFENTNFYIKKHPATIQDKDRISVTKLDFVPWEFYMEKNRVNNSFLVACDSTVIYTHLVFFNNYVELSQLSSSFYKSV